MKKQLQQHLVAQNTSGWSKRDLLKIDGSNIERMNYDTLTLCLFINP
jgi:hypothetical protein